MIKKDLRTIADMINSTLINSSLNDILISGICIDSRKVQKGNLFVPIKGINANGHNYINSAIDNGCVATLWNKNEPNPPDSIGVILVDDTTLALQKLATSYRNSLNLNVIGISGSNGKTSTKDMLAALFSVRFKTQKTMGNYNNEFGVPLTILSLDEDCEVAVVEMGLERKGDLLFLKDMVKPNIGILTNVGTAHLENFNCVEEIANAKLEIAACIQDNGLFIYNGDDKLINGEIPKISINETLTVKKFGYESDNNLYYRIIEQNESGISFETYGELNDIFSINMLGKHQALNALSAILAAKELNLTTDDIKKGLNNIEKTGLRNELVKIKSCTILNDSYKSNPQSTLAALDTFEALSSPKKIVVLGDMLGLGENEAKLHYEIGTKLSGYKIDELVTCGDLAKNIAEGAKGIIKSIKVFDDKNLMIEYLSKYLDDDCMMLVKASRSLEFDEVVDKLKLK